MGSKTEARDRMEKAGVPVLPGRRLDGEAGDALAAIADQIGYPLLVKASAGGGGKGMRLVESAGELEGGVEGARREAAAAFGDDTVFLERFAPRSRHVEIQIMGDMEGAVAALGERDCSVQRRHQKVIEESPSPVVDQALRTQMSEAAVAAGQALGYVGAGTVEFLLTEDGEFFFLEVNTRLQVEHPVTELVTGLDLVELQIAVAEGRPLPAEAIQPDLQGHAVEARLYAEDAANDFLPVTGTLSRFRVPAGVRVDTGVEDGAEISPYYDPMVAKVVAHGATRADAVRLLADALTRAELHGTTTNRDFLVGVLRHDEFAEGDADTSFLDRHDPAELARPLLGEHERRLSAAAAALALQAARRAEATVLASAPSGWRNVPAAPHEVTFADGDHELVVAYAFDRVNRLVTLEVDGEPIEGAALHDAAPDHVDLEAGGHRRRFSVHAEAGGRRARELRRGPAVAGRTAPPPGDRGRGRRGLAGLTHAGVGLEGPGHGRRRRREGPAAAGHRGDEDGARDRGARGRPARGAARGRGRPGGRGDDPRGDRRGGGRWLTPCCTRSTGRSPRSRSTTPTPATRWATRRWTG